MAAAEKEPVSLAEVQTEIENQLSCALCLERFSEPKVLACNHIYCKSCIDKLLQFRPDGSAIIDCPLKCDLQTSVACDKTTNDLATNFYIQGILDKIGEKYPSEKNLGKRCGDSGCDKEASAFCYACDFLLCTSCRCKHGILHKEDFARVKHDRDDQSLLIVCEEHNTEAQFVCFEPQCNSKFLCLYCIERNHYTHYKEKIGVKSGRIKHWLNIEKESTLQADASIGEINNMKKKDSESIREGRQNLQRILKERTIDRISQVMKQAESAATKLLNEFDMAVDIHRKSYPETNVDEFFRRFDDADDALVALMEKNAVKYLAKLASAKISLPTVSISLTDTTELDPFGMLKVEAGPNKSINDECLESNFRFDDGCCGGDECFQISDLWEGVEKLVGEKKTDLSLPEVAAEEKNISKPVEVAASIQKIVPESHSSEADPIRVQFHKSIQTVQQPTEVPENAPAPKRVQFHKSVQTVQQPPEMPENAEFNPAVLITYGFKFIVFMSVFIGILSFIISGFIVGYGSYYFLPSLLHTGGKVDGGYTEWTDFSPCSVTCGTGLHSRERFCLNPAPKNGGRSCSELGSNKETKNCSQTACTIDGGYTAWGNFGPCSSSCGKGLRTRERYCSNPSPRKGGKSCSMIGPSLETEQCNLRPCPVDGGYSEWGKFESCSRTCGKGMRARKRFCSNPAPAYGGMDCSKLGNAIETEECSRTPCPIDGGYTEWGNFGPCSKSCGKGLRTRERYCSNPKPKNGGRPCSVIGPSIESDQCDVHPCPPPTFDFHFVNKLTETVERSYPEYKAEFVGFGIGIDEDDRDAYQGTLRKRVSSLPKCLKFCAEQKKIDPSVNGAQYEMYGVDVCFCEHGFVSHRARNDHLHYKLL